LVCPLRQKLADIDLGYMIPELCAPAACGMRAEA
jgi:hypothetical protein